MALDTRLIGQATGGGRPLDLAGAVRPAIMRGEQAFERRKKEKAAYVKAKKERDAFSSKLLSQIESPSFKGVPQQGLSWLSEKAGKLKKQSQLIALDPNLSNIQKQIFLSELKDEVNELNYWADKYKNSHADYIEKSDMLSNINSAKDLEIDRMRIAGDFTYEGDEAIFNIDGEEIRKPMSEMSSSFNLIEKDHKAYNDLLKNVDEIAMSTASKGKDKAALTYEISRGFDSLNLSDTQLATLSIDQLGSIPNKQGEMYDEDTAGLLREDIKDGVIDDVELKNNITSFLKEQITTAANQTYSVYFNKKEDDGVDESVEQTKTRASAYVNELNNALSNYDLSMLHNSKIAGKLITGSEIRNGKLYLEYIARTTAEGQEIAELAPIDLNDKNKLKALLQEYVKGQKGMSMSNKISNFISDSELLTIAEVNKQNSILFPSPTTKPELP